MSGGHFDYAQYRLNDISTALQTLIENNEGENVDFDQSHHYNFDNETICNLKLLRKILMATEQMVHDADWMISGDTGPDSFNPKFNSIITLLDHDLKGYKNSKILDELVEEAQKLKLGY